MYIKKGDKVQVLSGKDRGKQGVILRALPAENKVVVEGVSVVKKAVKPNAANQQGGIVSQEAPIDASNVNLVCPEGGKVTRVGHEKDGKNKLGFLGGMAVPAVIRYGYGFVQGASAAAAEMGVKVEMNYSWLYGASFAASTELQTMASGWYENGTEVIFACGGNMFQSVAAAAAANDGAVVGVDVDQSSQSDTVITSAMKGLSASVQWACGKVYDGSFDEIGGTFVTLGAKDNAVGLPTATWSLTKWTVDDYNAMLAKMADGSLVVDNDYSKLDSTDSLTLNLVK